MKTWVKGGLIGILVEAILTLLFFAPKIFGLLSGEQGMYLVLYFLPGALMSPLFGFSRVIEFGAPNNPAMGFTIWTLSIIFWSLMFFIIGAILGWIVGLIKARKQ